MTQDHPITPPPELVQQWMRAGNMDIAPFHLARALATQAARWGADQELEACCEWTEANNPGYWDAHKALRAARRPKPPSLKEQALERCNDYIDPDGIIRRALEQLDD